MDDHLSVKWKKSMRDYGDWEVIKFFCKVYSIISLQLLVMLGTAALFIFEENTRKWTQQNPETVWFGLGATLIWILFLGSFDVLRRSFPTNLIVLVTLTLIESFTLGTVAVVYDNYAVLSGIVYSFIFCMSINIVLIRNLNLIIALLIIIIPLTWVSFGFMEYYLHDENPSLHWGMVAAIMFFNYLVIDSILILLEKHYYQITALEVLFGVANLHTDVVQILKWILVSIKVLHY